MLHRGLGMQTSDPIFQQSCLTAVIQLPWLWQTYYGKHVMIREVYGWSHNTNLQLRRLQLFSSQDHPNTLAPINDDELWVVLHKLGEVGAAKPDLSVPWLTV